MLVLPLLGPRLRGDERVDCRAYPFAAVRQPW
jgi:hypothetical protein